MRILFLLIILLIAPPIYAKNWIKVNDTWEVDTDSIIKTKKYCIVWLHDTYNNMYYYNQYMINVPQKIIRQVTAFNTKTHYPNGKNPISITNEDYQIIKAICSPAYTYKENPKETQKINKPIGFNNLTAIKVQHNIEFVFRVYSADIQQKTETSLFYIDTKNKQVYQENKTKVDYIKEFNDSIISFMIIDYTNKFKICRCYDIDRYTGNVSFTLFQHPLTLGAKFDHGMLDIKNGYVGYGSGTAIKVDATKQKF